MLSIQENPTNYDEQQKNKILEIISDYYCRKIFSVILKEPKTAVEINEITKIPISTIYRRLQVIHDVKLLRISGEINEYGKKSFFYQSKIKSISIIFTGNFLEIDIIHNNAQKPQDR